MTDLLKAARIEIGPFDPLTAATESWAKFHAFRRARMAEDYPGDPATPDAELEADLRRHDPLYEWRRTLAMRDGEFVASVNLFLRRPGSPGCEEHATFVNFGGGVRREYRRQGIGRALMAELLRFMRNDGRTIATVGTHLPEGHAFMAALGAAQKHRSAENRLPFGGLDWDELARWQAQVPPGFAWETHAGRVPMARLATLTEPFSDLINEQPLGALEMPRMRYEAEGYVTWYADMDRRGGEHFLVMLTHEGELAAMCDANWDARFPERVYQQLTAVSQPWRGKGLAKAVKAAMLNLIRARHPDVQTMITTNADANAPMLSINRRLGFVVHRQHGTYQLGTEALARFIGESRL
jgi:GNAT superfamily N-acetyltransferase